MFYHDYFELIWDHPVGFGDPEQNLTMIYYGVLFFKSTFIGLGVLRKNEPKIYSQLEPKMV